MKLRQAPFKALQRLISSRYTGVSGLIEVKTPSQKPPDKTLEKTSVCYSQGGNKSLVEYLNRSRAFINARLSFEIDSVDEVIGKTSTTYKRNQSCVSYMRKQINHDFPMSIKHKVYLQQTIQAYCSEKLD